MIDNKSNSGKENSGNRNSGNWNSGDRNSGNWNSGNWNSGNWNSGDMNSGHKNSGDWNSGNMNSGDWNSGEWNSGNWNSGNMNSGNWNSGYLNSNSPKVRIFNKDCDLDFDSEIFKKLRGIFDNIKPVCTWVEECRMSDEEKSEFKSYKTTGGYLKKRDYKYCWKKSWYNMSDEDQDFIKSLPNFDKDIFFEITGINVEEDQTQSIIIDGQEIKISDESFQILKNHFINLNK